MKYQSAMQMWACVLCDTERQWGHGAPLDELQTPVLTCAGTCGKEVATLHRYSGMSVFKGAA